MTASLAERTLLAFGVAGTVACAAPEPPPLGSPLEPLPIAPARVPDDSDLAARDLALSALGEPRAGSRMHLDRLQSLEYARRAEGAAPTGIIPTAIDLMNATADDPIAYRRESQALLERDDLSPALRHRLEAAIADDPLRLADRRLRDAMVEETAEVFNALVGPIARGVTTGVRGVWGLFRALVNVAINEHLEEELEMRERQALAHWKRFLDLHPDAPEAIEIARRTEETQRRWTQTRRDRAMRAARKAVDNESWRAALVLAEQASHYAPEDLEAQAIRERATREIERQRAQRRRSLEADPATGALELDPDARALALALLHPEGDVPGVARAILERGPDVAFADEARFALALTESESGDPRAEDRAWEILEDVADLGISRANMARHAEALVESPYQNPFRAFEEARGRDRAQRVAWIFFGPLASGPRDRDLPGVFEWLIDLPGFVEMLTSFPNRLVRYPWLEPWPFGRAPAFHARRYLRAHPHGAHVEEAAEWLEDWEEDRGNWIGAYELAAETGIEDPDDLAELRERAARQGLEGALRQQRPDMRLTALRHVAKLFQGTEAGQEAGEQARRELEQASFQRIRISRGFLEENPVVAGSEGIGLRDELLDGENQNGELHPDGVVLVGGRILEFHFLDESGRSSAPAVIRREKVSRERLARLVALLDETAIRNQAADPEDVLGPDPDRDLFFERARLGLADAPDRRPSARSSYAFLGMRERYGLVRSRESILPFEIVVQGSLPDVGLGVFPRLRRPKPTPDAFLYR